MNDKTLLHSILIQTGPTGSVVSVMATSKTAKFHEGEQLTAWALLDPVDLDYPLATEHLGAINAGLLARVAEADALTATVAILEAQAKIQLYRIATLEATIAALTKPPSPATLAFRALPSEIQEAFQGAYDTAALLVEAGRTDLAIAHIEGLAVPTSLEPVRANIVALLSDP